MTDELRRRDDVLLSDIDKRLALLEQATSTAERTRDARDKAFEHQLSAVGARIEAAITLWQQTSSEPQASPAGRAVLARVEPLEETVADHEVFIQQAQGAMRLARYALGTSVISLVLGIITIASLIVGK